MYPYLIPSLSSNFKLDELPILPDSNSEFNVAYQFVLLDSSPIVLKTLTVEGSLLIDTVTLHP